MKSLIKLLLWLGIVVPALVLTSCKEDTTTIDQSEFDVLTEYMAQNSLDLADVLDGWVKPGTAITVEAADDYLVDDYYVIDLRGADDFNTGHINGAVNATLGNILDVAPAANGKPILVVCYTGQAAARAVGFLRLLEYEAYSLKWGMSAWHSNFAGKWENAVADLSHSNWLATGNPAELRTFTAPNITTGETEGRAILEARIRTLLSTDWTLTNPNVLDNPGNYFINNKWSQASFDAFGHIQGAYRFDVADGLGLAGLDRLDPGAEIVTYCYTGQTSAITGAWLQALGFTNAKSLKFGVNAISHTALLNGKAKNAWGGDGSASFLNYGYVDSDGNVYNPMPQ